MKLSNKKIKDKIMRIGYRTKASHIASAMSCVDVLCDTYNAFPNAIVIVSKGHGVLAQYVILNELGKMPTKVLKTYYQDGGLSIHSTVMKKYGVYASTGSLGHGLAIGVGYAIANPKEMVFVLLSDGELDEGQTIEAMKIINRLKIKNIVVLVDWNDLSAVEGINKEEWMQFSYRPYYSIKGHGWGKLENKVASHYAIINKEILSEWKKNSQRIEDERLKRIEDGKKLLKSLKRKRNVR